MATNLEPVGAEQAVFIVPDDGTKIDVKIASENVWLTAGQMGALFDRHASVVRKHVQNVFDQGELPGEGGYAQILRESTGGRPDTAYSLDVIISVGYRVKSQRGVEFRQWATRILKQRLLQEYRNRDEKARNVLAGLKNIQLLAGSSTDDEDDPAEVLELIEQYARSWQLLLQYDEDRLPAPSAVPTKKMARLTVRQATDAIDRFRKSLAAKGEATDLFGRDRGDGLASILGNLEQTWDGSPVYPNVDIRAAHLLYFVIKNHPFVDGNKRIGSLLFLHYLDKNSRPLLEDSALVALALLIAESAPKHKDMVIRLIVSLMSSNGGASNI